ncbi:MAG: hypothetical protein Q8K11_03595 [Phenylobacterium sp.]|uniref:hypothetical protein n=1 Tax=Phenylobacterium sp. TaxID=1871053 RepID=UPI00272F1497|nr:hypothetical protein [Phenylobacterium sp.]MDP2009241.1 hypothetical protein [Phenylobacterium sp.]MDP3632191.1 hypothetical protein [Phenylobacterium sp.]
MTNGSPVGSDHIDAIRDAQILTLRQISENLAAQTRRLEGLTAKVDDVRERLVRLEAQEAGKLVETLRSELKAAVARVDLLEATRDKVAGAAVFWNWMVKSAPWLAAGVSAFAAGMGLKSLDGR